MLQLKNICKEYRTGDLVQKALDHVSLTLRDNEFVAILGPSGSGKTTLLNVVGGLDRYDSGDLIINGVSTKKYKDRDWDAYRNHTIGFVFQSYNLIMHQSVLANVELALTISGISGAERRKRAEEALQKVGLGEQMHKRPAQMSGGQMQRVAIARALVNDPDIVLADEPTGALDSETSIQVMDLLKEVAKDRLVVMVTHNPDLAVQYATRIVRIKDGRVQSDSDPYTLAEEEQTPPVSRRLGRASMSFLTALSLSFNNLRTKKARTFLVSFAGSIGIIGIALILALSSGANRYIKAQEQETLSQYPLEIQRTGYDLTSFMSGGSSGASSGGLLSGNDRKTADDRIAVQSVVDSLFSGVSTNDLAAFKKALDADEGGINQYVNGIEYDYDVTPRIYRIDEESGKAVQLNPNNQFDSLATGQIDVSSMMSGTLGADYFYSLPSSSALYEDTYDIKAGHWPESNDQLVLVLNQNGEISDLLLYELGVRDETVLEEKIKSLSAQNSLENSADSSASAGSGEVSSDSTSSEEAVTGSVSSSSADAEETYSYDTFLGMQFKLVRNADLYTYDSQMGVWTDHSDEEDFTTDLAKNGKNLEIVGIVQPKSGVTATSLDPGIAYPHALVTDLIAENEKTQVVKDQLADQDRNVLTGNLFSEDEQSESGFDLSRLITVDPDALQEALGADAGNLQNLDLSALAKQAGTGLSGNGSIPDFDVGSLNLSQLQSLLPSLSEADIRSLAGTIRFNDVEEQLKLLFGQLLDGFETYTAKDPSTDYAKLSDSMQTYFQSDDFRKNLEGVLSDLVSANSGSVLTGDDIRQMVSPLVRGYVEYEMAKPEMQDPQKAAEYAADPQKLVSDLTSPSAIAGYLTDPDSGASALVDSALKTVQEKISGMRFSNDQLSKAGEKLLQGYDTYAAANGGPVLSKLPDAFAAYLQSSDAKKLITDAAGKIVDTDDFEKAAANLLQKTMTQTAGNLEKQIESAAGSVMSSVMAQITSALEQSVQDFSSSMGTDLFSFDPETLSKAIKMNMDAGQIRELITSMVSGQTSSYEDNLGRFGYADPDNPSEIRIYSKDFDAKNQVTDIIAVYNQKAEDAGDEDKVIRYTDMIAAMMSSVTRIINAISYILIGFVGISLVVSSIMIGVITYISVLERKKEIGILRAMGASKHNVAQVFNAETFITGLLAGLIGVGVTVILTYPANLIIRKVTNIEGIHAALPAGAAAALVLLSVLLTMLAGLIPAGKASRSDPVTALRNE